VPDPSNDELLAWDHPAVALDLVVVDVARRDELVADPVRIQARKVRSLAKLKR